MLRSFFLFTLVLVFTFQAFAGTGPGMKLAFDEYFYAMEVEGGFQDKTLAARAKDELQQKIRQQLKVGVSKQEIMEETMALLPDKKLQNDIRALSFQVNTNKLTEEQFTKQVEFILGRARNTGASWSGVGDEILGATLAVLILVGIFLYFDSTRPPCPEDGTYVPNCRLSPQQWEEQYGDG